MGIGMQKVAGKIVHFFPKINVAVVELAEEISKGQEISIKGPLTDFAQKADSMQIEHTSIEKGKKGQMIGLRVDKEVRKGDLVYVNTG